VEWKVKWLALWLYGQVSQFVMEVVLMMARAFCEQLSEYHLTLD
jgi:hypothetical protein